MQNDLTGTIDLLQATVSVVNNVQESASHMTIPVFAPSNSLSMQPQSKITTQQLPEKYWQAQAHQQASHTDGQIVPNSNGAVSSTTVLTHLPQPQQVTHTQPGAAALPQPAAGAAQLQLGACDSAQHDSWPQHINGVVAEQCNGQVNGPGRPVGVPDAQQPGPLASAGPRLDPLHVESVNTQLCAPEQLNPDRAANSAPEPAHAQQQQVKAEACTTMTGTVAAVQTGAGACSEQPSAPNHKVEQKQDHAAAAGPGSDASQSQTGPLVGPAGPPDAEGWKRDASFLDIVCDIIRKRQHKGARDPEVAIEFTDILMGQAGKVEQAAAQRMLQVESSKRSTTSTKAAADDAVRRAGLVYAEAHCDMTVLGHASQKGKRTAVAAEEDILQMADSPPHKKKKTAKAQGGAKLPADAAAAESSGTAADIKDAKENGSHKQKKPNKDKDTPKGGIERVDKKGGKEKDAKKGGKEKDEAKGVKTASASKSPATASKGKGSSGKPDRRKEGASNAKGAEKASTPKRRKVVEQVSELSSSEDELDEDVEHVGEDHQMSDPLQGCPRSYLPASFALDDPAGASRPGNSAIKYTYQPTGERLLSHTAALKFAKKQRLQLGYCPAGTDFGAMLDWLVCLSHDQEPAMRKNARIAMVDTARRVRAVLTVQQRVELQDQHPEL